MDVKEILKRVDHTLLNQESTWEQIQEICDDAVKYETASVCIPPSFVAAAREYLDEKSLKTGKNGVPAKAANPSESAGPENPAVPAVCTVIGFPNGYCTKAVKAFETRDALSNGADEIDMVINVGDVKMGNYEQIRQEIRELKEICGHKILKVIIETCLLTDEEKINMCRVVTEAGADYIKTSTGFSTGGATLHDVELFAAHVGPGVKIKAAGGISSLEDAEAFINAGASRLGTSRVVKILKEKEQQNG